MRRFGIITSTFTVCAIAACSDATAPTPVPHTVQVTANGSFGPSGTVTITNISGVNSTLSGNLIGFDANSSHSVAIVNGSCSAPGSTVLTLANIDASSSGQATIPSTSVPDDAVAPGHAIVFYESTSSTGAIIACGDMT
jgi:hypothetical protein